MNLDQYLVSPLNEDASSFGQSLQTKYGLKDLWMHDLPSRNAIELSSLIVDRVNQKQGTGSAVMAEIIQFADRENKILVLDLGLPNKEHGTTSKTRLRKFYQRFGFTNNQGRSKNFLFRHSMIRYPQPLSEAIKYPTAGHDEWYGDRQYQDDGGELVMMTPDEYISKVRPLTLDDVSQENIGDLVQHIRSGKTLDPLKIYANGKEDGRHRAYAAKKLGIKQVPVIVWPKVQSEAIDFVRTGKNNKLDVDLRFVPENTTGKIIARFDDYILLLTGRVEGVWHGNSILIMHGSHAAGIILLSQDWAQLKKMDKKLLQISTSVIAKKYEGKGLMYRAYVALIEAGYNLLSDESQTTGGQIIWSKLAKTTGIYVYAVEFGHLNINFNNLSKSDANTSIKFYDVNPDDITDGDITIYQNSSAKQEAKHLKRQILSCKKTIINIDDELEKSDKNSPKYNELVDQRLMYKTELDKAITDHKSIQTSIEGNTKKNVRLMATKQLQSTDKSETNEAISHVGTTKDDKFGVDPSKLGKKNTPSGKIIAEFDDFKIVLTTANKLWPGKTLMVIKINQAGSIAAFIGLTMWDEEMVKLGDHVLQISTVVTSKHYDGQNIMLRAYKALVDHGFTLISDKAQTIGAQKLWGRLAKTPGVYVYAADFGENPDEFSSHNKNPTGGNIKYYDVNPDDITDSDIITHDHSSVEVERRELLDYAKELKHQIWALEDRLEVAQPSSSIHAELTDQIKTYTQEMMKAHNDIKNITSRLYDGNENTVRLVASKMKHEIEERKSDRLGSLQEAINNISNNKSGAVDRPKYGYKVMNYNNETGEVISGADSRVTQGIKLRKGITVKMPGKGIFMSTNRDYVIQYYSGHNEHEAIIKFEFDPNTITSGNLTDHENEFTVPRAQVVDFEIINHLDEAVSHMHSYGKDDKLGIRFETIELSGKPIGRIGPYKVYASDNINYNSSVIKSGLIVWDHKANMCVAILTKKSKNFEKTYHKKTFGISVAAVNGAYDGQGIMLKLYLLLLKQGYALMCDNIQTDGGQKLWARLARQPGIYVYAVDITSPSDPTFSDVDSDDITSADFTVYDTEKNSKARHDRDWDKLNREIMDLDQWIYDHPDETEKNADIQDQIKMKTHELDAIRDESNAWNYHTNLDRDTRLMAVAEKKTTNESVDSRQPITELFDKGYEYKWRSNGKSAWARLPNNTILEVVFDEYTKDNFTIEFNRNSEMATTGEGDEFNIFATVIKIIAEFDKTNQAEKYAFVAEKNPQHYGRNSDSRIKLYDRLVQKFASRIGMNFSINDSGYQHEYLLYREKDKSKLAESFDSKPYIWDWDLHGQNAAIGEFDTDDGGKIKVFFQTVSPNSNNWELAFKKGSVKYPHLYTPKRTGEGDQHRIFATVIDIIKDFMIITKNVNSLTFLAKREGAALDSPSIRDNRAELYKLMLKRFANQQRFEFAWETVGRATEFILRRKDTEAIPETTEIEIIKPHPNDTLGVKRHEMPQVHSSHYPALIDYLTDHGAKFSRRRVSAKQLKPIQSEFSDDGVRKMIATQNKPSDSKTEKPLIVSSDNYIIDGHHRWLASYNLNQDVLIMQVSLPVKRLLQLVREFPHTTYRAIHETLSQMEIACLEGGHVYEKPVEAISESFDNPYSYTWLSQGRTFWTAKARTQSGDTVSIQAGVIEPNANILNVPPEQQPKLLHNPMWGVMFSRNNKTIKTNGGDQQRIFATVLDALSDWYSAVRPSIIMFSSDKDGDGSASGRVKLYQMLTKKLSAKIGYKTKILDSRYKTYFFMYKPSLKLFENMSDTGTLRHQQERDHELTPGSDAWFQHWFSKPLLSRVEVDSLKEQTVNYLKSRKGVQHEKKVRPRRVSSP